jgi:leader peptidase (prepilin peptidase) / N-methyltransferase
MLVAVVRVLFPLPVLVPVLAVLGALVVGPGLNHAVRWWIGWRVVLPQLTGTVAARSELGPARAACPVCEAALARPVLPVPTFSWIALGGRCPECRVPIDERWPLAVELVTGLLWGLAGLAAGWSITLVPVLLFLSGLVAASTVDLACGRIPTLFVYLTGVPAAAGMVLAALVHGEPESLLGGLVGAGVVMVTLGSLWLLSPRMLGFGDVRLGTLVGLVVGWVGWSADEPVLDPLTWVVRAMLAAGVLGSLAGGVLLVVRRRNQSYPFGPWLSIGGALAVLLAASAA